MIKAIYMPPKHLNMYLLMKYMHLNYGVEVTWNSGNVMDCHVMARVSIPDQNGVFIELHVLRKGQ